MQQYRPTGFSLLPPVVKNLLIINGLVFLARLAIGQVYKIDINDYLGLRYFFAESFEPYQIITYMFMHADLGHLFFNMFALWMFGYALENIWGPKRFLTYYFVTGIGAALVHYIVMSIELAPFIEEINSAIANSANDPKALEYYKNFKVTYLNSLNVVGASGAVFGILLAFGMMFPNTYIYIYFLFPLKAKYFVMIYGALELFFGLAGSGDNIAHFAHLGGMIFGFVLIMYWSGRFKRRL